MIDYMRKRFVRAIVIVLGSMWLGMGMLMAGITADSIELASSGVLIMLVGAVISYMHLTYRDDDNKHW